MGKTLVLKMIYHIFATANKERRFGWFLKTIPRIFGSLGGCDSRPFFFCIL